MASKLDQSLDAIIGDRSTPRRGRARRARPGRAAPVGGVKKASTAVGRTAAKGLAKAANKSANAADALAPASGGATKVMVSNLPTDVNEAQIKDYFQQVAGPVRRVWLTYGPNGASRGIATILFNNAASAKKAMDQKGTKVDNRTLRVEAILTADATTAPGKTLKERASAPNTQPRKATAAPVAASKAGNAGNARGAASRGRGRAPRGRTSRPKKKTMEELDAEMVDYMGTGSGTTAAAPAVGGAAAAPATAAPAGGDDLGMDEIS